MAWPGRRRRWPDGYRWNAAARPRRAGRAGAGWRGRGRDGRVHGGAGRATGALGRAASGGPPPVGAGGAGRRGGAPRAGRVAGSALVLGLIAAKAVKDRDGSRLGAYFVMVPGLWALEIVLLLVIVGYLAGLLILTSQRVRFTRWGLPAGIG